MKEFSGLSYLFDGTSRTDVGAASMNLVASATVGLEHSADLPDGMPAVQAGDGGHSGGWVGDESDAENHPLVIWIKQIKANLGRGKKVRLDFVQELERKCREILNQPCSLVPYGSVVYDVLVKESDVDATLLLHGAMLPTDHRATLQKLQEEFKTAEYNTQLVSAAGGRMQLLKVQKSVPDDVPFHVDLCINGASNIHKSQLLADKLQNLGESMLPFIVKAWAQKNELTRDTDHRSMLPSYGWMLLVVDFLEQEQEQEQGIAPSTVTESQRWLTEFCDFLCFLGEKDQPIKLADRFALPEDGEAVQIEGGGEELEDAPQQALDKIKDNRLPW